MPRVTRWGERVPLTTYFAPLAESSKMLTWLMAIWCPLAFSLIIASLERSLMEMPTAGRRYVVSSRIFKSQPSGTILFFVCGILPGLFLLWCFLGVLL